MARSGKIPGNLWHQKEFARSVPNGHGQPELIVVGSSISAEKSINAGCRCAAIWFGRLSKSELPIPMLRLEAWGLLSLDICAPVSCEMPRGLMMMGMIPWNFHPRTNTPKSRGDTNKDELLTGR